jgi:hypothetical protein
MGPGLFACPPGGPQSHGDGRGAGAACRAPPVSPGALRALSHGGPRGPGQHFRTTQTSQEL